MQVSSSSLNFWQRHSRPVLVAAGAALIAAPIFSMLFRDSFAAILFETSLVSAILLAAFLLAGAWRQTWVPRWVAQVLCVIAVAPLGPLIVHLVEVQGDLHAFTNSRPRVVGFWWVTISAAVVGLLVTLAALVRERDAQTRAQALQFALERETLMRQSTDARLNLLQAQIEPHFLLNTHCQCAGTGGKWIAAGGPSFQKSDRVLAGYPTPTPTGRRIPWTGG